VSWGLAVNLAVNRGAADHATRTRYGKQPCATRAARWLGGGDHQHAQACQPEHTQVTRSLPMGSGVSAAVYLLTSLLVACCRAAIDGAPCSAAAGR
jgi:hypothetical protein